eukprot:TRINITY_DN19449_c0_g1_i2.p1 TRINITY_DN19449_c0_g1~~TRINITY_DN19449_c0_g1_i2.p1  ORF type:complete len:261 (+),score=114.89 TRINITY_DN19449_c0_g1_i2:52-834(+)
MRVQQVLLDLAEDEAAQKEAGRLAHLRQKTLHSQPMLVLSESAQHLTDMAMKQHEFASAARETARRRAEAAQTEAKQAPEIVQPFREPDWARRAVDMMPGCCGPEPTEDLKQWGREARERQRIVRAEDTVAERARQRQVERAAGRLASARERRKLRRQGIDEAWKLRQHRMEQHLRDAKEELRWAAEEQREAGAELSAARAALAEEQYALGVERKRVEEWARRERGLLTAERQRLAEEWEALADAKASLHRSRWRRSSTR